MHRMLAWSNFEGQDISFVVDRHLEWKDDEVILESRRKKKA